MNKVLKTTKRKNKVIRLNSEESIMEGNSVQLPFIAPYRGDVITSIEYVWTTTANGKLINRCIEVSGHGSLGVPTLKDKKVLRALQDIYIWSKVKNGVLDLEKDLSKVKDEDLLIKFESIDKIAMAMGYKTISGQQRKSIKESIDRLVGTTIFVKHDGGIYNPVLKKYITDSSKTFRYIEEAESYTWYNCEKCSLKNSCDKNTASCVNNNDKKNKKNVASIRISKFFYESIANNFRLYYNRKNANEIKNLIAENIYLISRKWIGDGYVSNANIQRYIDRIPMACKAEKHKKQAIKEAIYHLDTYSFVDAKIEKDVVTIKHLDKIPTDNLLNKKDKLPTDVSYLKDKYVTFQQFKDGMIELGFKECEFYSLIDVFIEKIEYLKALLRYVNLRNHYNSETNPKQHYIKCLEKYINIDKKYYSNID